jgi:hypothetical protein
MRRKPKYRNAEGEPWMWKQGEIKGKSVKAGMAPISHASE